MANNVFQVKRTSTAGRTPNTTGSYATNTQYIGAGEFALNMADQILYTSNGSVVITVGANLVNQNVSNTLTVKAISANGGVGSAGQVLTSNASAVYWDTPAAGTPGTGTGNGADTSFFINGQTVNTDYTTAATSNYLSAGPITLNANVVITTGSRWAVV